MFPSCAIRSTGAARAARVARAARAARAVRSFADVASPSPVTSAARNHKVVVVGGGAAGLSVSHQLLRTGRFAENDIAVVDPATWNYYQPGWTLVGGGLKNKEDLKYPMHDLIDPKLRFYNDGVSTFSPDDNYITLANGDKVAYDQLVVAPGIKINYDSIKGLPEALADTNSLVSTIYGYETCDKAFRTVESLHKGDAIFTFPSGIIKCAGAPQKVMWLAWDNWQRAGLYKAGAADSPIKISYATALPVMFGVPKYSAKLNELRQDRGVEGLFQHDLVEVNGDQAIFALPDGKKVVRRFDLLHAVPKMGPHPFVAKSPLADATGLVDVDQATTRHKKFSNVWSLGDASSLPTAKTAAAITSEAPVLVSNMLRVLEGKEPEGLYDGYTSCPLLTEYGKVLLAEFKYGAQPKETFANWLGIDQIEPRRAFYHLKKDFFPWVYRQHMLKGTWAGPKGFKS